MLKFVAFTRPLAAARRTSSADSVGRHRERLLADDVLAGREDLAALAHVQVVGGGDMDDVDGVVRQQRVK